MYRSAACALRCTHLILEHQALAADTCAHVGGWAAAGLFIWVAQCVSASGQLAAPAFRRRQAPCALSYHATLAPSHPLRSNRCWHGCCLST